MKDALLVPAMPSSARPAVPIFAYANLLHETLRGVDSPHISSARRSSYPFGKTRGMWQTTYAPPDAQQPGGTQHRMLVGALSALDCLVFYNCTRFTSTKVNTDT